MPRRSRRLSLDEIKGVAASAGGLDPLALTERQDVTGQVWLTWLRQMPEAAKPTAMLGVIERLEYVRAIEDAFGAIASVISWERFCKTVAEAEAIARPEEFDAFQSLGEHHAGIRRWSPAFLSAFAFESVPASASLLRAVEVLREVNSKDTAVLPKWGDDKNCA